MMRITALLLAANSLFAADFLTGQAARAVIGQPYFTAQLAGPASAIYPGNMLLGAVGGLAYANGMLVVADSSPFRQGTDPQNNRVLIYRSIFGPGDPESTTGPTQLPPPTVVAPLNSNSQYWWCPVCGGRADIVLGQPDFNGTAYAGGASGMRTPTAVATDGTHLVVADTDNNRVLLWNSIPTANGQVPDMVLGQPDFDTVTPNTGTPNVLIPAANSLRGPEGVWIQGAKLFVADTMNNRVLIWNSWPAKTQQPADVVLGQPDFTTQTQGDLTKGTPPATAKNMLNPASVTSDGTRVFVADLAQNRVLIWDAIPTQNEVAADVVIGQPDMVSSAPDNAYTSDANGVQTPVLCKVSNGKDTNGNPTYPTLCEYTISTPRFALSDGTRLFVADGGNDRVLVYNTIPTANAAKADVALGQQDFTSDRTTDNPNDTVNSFRIASADSVRTPTGLAWDGTNLFVSEAFSRRVLVFTAASSPTLIAPRNAASMEVFAGWLISLSGSPKAGDILTTTVEDAAGNTVDYAYTVVTGDTLASVANGVASSINSSNSGAGDPNVTATSVPSTGEVQVLARVNGPNGSNNNVTIAASTGASTVASAASVSRGSDAAHVAPATLVAIFGENLMDGDPITAAMDGVSALPTTLGHAPASVQAFANGIPLPLLYVSSTQINAQIPYEIAPTTSISVYVRTTHADGSVTIANSVALPVQPGVPGFFAYSLDTSGNVYKDPRPAIALHYSSKSMGAVDLELTSTSPKAGDTVSVTIGSNTYTYTIQSTDTTLDNVRDGLIGAVNADPTYQAFPGGQWDRLVLLARTPGTQNDGVTYTATSSGSGTVSAAGLTAKFCCANTGDVLITADNPAKPGEIVTLYATGLGLVQPTPAGGFVTGAPYPLDAAFPNKVADFTNEFVSGTVGGKTAQVLNAAMVQGTIGLYQVDLLLSEGLTTNPAAQVTIAQVLNVTNIVTIPVQTAQ